jgi:hypothetical protein
MEMRFGPVWSCFQLPTTKGPSAKPGFFMLLSDGLECAPVLALGVEL